jgi:hypothetical protein
MSIVKKLATVPFAHLLGIRAESETDEEKKDREEQEAKRAEWAKKAESDPDRKQRDDESDEDYAKRMEEKDKEEESKAKKGEGDDPETDMADEDEKEKAARASERARCAKIIAHGIKNGCVRQAAVLAFDSQMTARVAILSLDASKGDMETSSRAGLGQRMAAVTVPNPGAGGAEMPNMADPLVAAQATAKAVIAAAAKARGEKA